MVFWLDIFSINNTSCQSQNYLPSHTSLEHDNSFSLGHWGIFPENKTNINIASILLMEVS